MNGFTVSVGKESGMKINAEIKKTGIYLRESSGAVGTLNHVDMVV